MRLPCSWSAVAFGILIGSTLVPAQDVNAQGASTVHTIFMTAVEVKGATTKDKLAPPPVNPADISKGYGFKEL